MSVAGLKKQFHKASQLLNEKLNGVEGTKLDEDFLKMERKIDVTHKMLLEIVPRTTEYLQPNPAYRAKLSMLNTVSRFRGQFKALGYPQTEGMLGDCMLHYSKELGAGSAFGSALGDIGEALKQMAQARDALDVTVKHNFIDPMQMLQDRDLKEIGHHLRKLEGRRLDFDYKKRRKGKVPEEEIRQAQEKFEDSKELAERSMFNFLQNDMDQVNHLSALVTAAMEYHRQSYQTLESLNSSLQARLTSASNQPKREFRSKSLRGRKDHSYKNGFRQRSSFKSVRPSDFQISPVLSEKNDSELLLDQPCCRALYTFQPENDGELGFKEGDLIILTNQIDDNWYEGMISGDSGFFPISYVDVLVPLPIQ